MLRIMDCFLLEGRKLFFRFSLAIFKQYQRRLTSMSDPVTIFQFMKEVARHIFNVEELFHVSRNTITRCDDNFPRTDLVLRTRKVSKPRAAEQQVPEPRGEIQKRVAGEREAEGRGQGIQKNRSTKHCKPEQPKD